MAKLKYRQGDKGWGWYKGKEYLGKDLPEKYWVSKGYGEIYSPKAKEFDWACGGDVEGCPIPPEAKVSMPLMMYHSAVLLAGRFEQEWLAYITGEWNPATHEAVLQDLYFPPQVVTPAHCQRIDEWRDFRPNTIGAIHSHVAMQASFSTEDKKHANWPVELVVNRRGEMKCSVKVALKCGAPSRIEAKVDLIGTEQGDLLSQSLTTALEEGTRLRPAPPAVHQPEVRSYSYQQGLGYVPADGWGRRMLPPETTLKCDDCGAWHRPSEPCSVPYSH